MIKRVPSFLWLVPIVTFALVVSASGTAGQGGAAANAERSVAAPARATSPIVSTSSASGGWQCYPPEPPTNCATLRSVAVVSANDVWAVGDLGTIIHYDGTTWHSVPSPTRADLYSVAMSSASEGWAVGQELVPRSPYPPYMSGVILRYRDGVWTRVERPRSPPLSTPTAMLPMLASSGPSPDFTVFPPPAGASPPLFSVTIVSPNEAWAVGGWSLGYWYYQPPTALHYEDSSWQDTTVPASPLNRGLRAVVAVSEEEAWAVGDGVYRYAGGAWQRVREGLTPGPYGDLESVTRDPADDLWAVGNDGILHRHSGGWEEVREFTSLKSVDMVSPTEGWAVGRYGKIVRYSGGSWSAVESPTSDDLLSVAMISGSDGFAVGERGTMLRYRDGKWQHVRRHEPMRLNSVATLRSGEAWAVGDAGLALHFVDNAWHRVATPVSSDLRGLAVLPNGEAWTTGSKGEILRYDGRTWSINATIPGVESFRSIAIVSPTEGWLSGLGYYGIIGLLKGRLWHYVGGNWQVVDLPDAGFPALSLSMVSATEGWAADGGLWRYSGGEWRRVLPQTSGIRGPVAMLPTGQGWVGGTPNGIWYYDGTSWQPQPAPRTDVTAIAPVSPTEAWAVAPMSSGTPTILHLIGGEWKTVEVPATYGLESLAMASAKEGWAVGEVIMRYRQEFSYAVDMPGVQRAAP